MTNFKNDNYFVISNAKQSVPASTNGTGTISTSGAYLTGSGTNFITKSQLKRGDWVVVLTANEVRRVNAVNSDTGAVLEEAFTSNLSSVTPAIISHTKMNLKLISLETSDNCFVDGSAFTGSLTFEKTGNDRSSRHDLIEPIIVDATGGNVEVEILKY